MAPALSVGEQVRLEDLVTAYRKAKVDLFYNDSPRRLDLVKYEADLNANLRDLFYRVQSADESWVQDPDFLGTFTFIPKVLKVPERTHRSFWSSPSNSWRRRWEGETERPTAKFRLMAECSIDLHVFATLWMLHVGTGLDGHLQKEARGSRLHHGPLGEPDHLSSGSFENYQTAYRRWRDDGLRAMKDGLALGDDVAQ